MELTNLKLFNTYKTSTLFEQSNQIFGKSLNWFLLKSRIRKFGKRLKKFIPKASY